MRAATGVVGAGRLDGRLGCVQSREHERRAGRRDMCMLLCSKECSGRSSRPPGRFLYTNHCILTRKRPSIVIHTAHRLRAPCAAGTRCENLCQRTRQCEPADAFGRAQRLICVQSMNGKVVCVERTSIKALLAPERCADGRVSRHGRAVEREPRFFHTVIRESGGRDIWC